MMGLYIRCLGYAGDKAGSMMVNEEQDCYLITGRTNVPINETKWSLVSFYKKSTHTIAIHPNFGLTHPA